MSIKLSRRRFIATGSALFFYGVRPHGKFLARSLSGFLSKYTIAVITDPHVDINGENGWRMGQISVAALRKTVLELNKSALDVVLIPGDLLADGEWENLTVAKEILNELTVPYYIISGNHDYRPADTGRLRKKFSYLNSDEFVKTFIGRGYNETGSLFWSDKITDDLRVIALDGNLRNEKIGWGGRLPEEQLNWLEEQLQHSLEPVIIMVHHCLLHWGRDGDSEFGRWFSLENAADVRNILAKYREKIVVVVSGHRHIGLHTKEIDGINYFVLPSINSYPMRYTIFELSKNMVKWITPMAPVEDEFHQLAKKGLLRSPWLHSLTNSQHLWLLQFYENFSQREGDIFTSNSIRF